MRHLTQARAALSRWKISFIAGSILAASALIIPITAQAQSVVALVNKSPVTSFDIDQRIRLAALTERRRLDRGTALKELVDDKLKLYEVRRIGYRVTEEGVDDEFTRLAKSNRQSANEFSANLRKAGIEPAALKDKIRADLAWQTLLRRQVQQGTNVSNKDVEQRVEDEQKKAKTVSEFRLRPVLFVVAAGTSASERMRAANAARGRFTSCETGFDELRSLKDVAIQDEVVRRSDSLSKALSDTINKTAIGRMTPPSATATGVEVIAVCEKREVTDSFGTRMSVENELTGKALETRSKALLETLRKSVPIEYKR